MLRNKPILKYSGITVILSNPGRFDKVNLITGNGGVLFGNHCLQPDFNQMQCDVRLTEDKSDFIPDTRCILLLGEKAMHEWVPDSRQNFLNELRGSPLYVRNIPAIASFHPQEAADIKNYEAQHNPLSEHYGESDDNDDDEDGDEKSLGPTKRGNYAFWLKHDVWKAKQCVLNKWTRWPTEPEPTYKIFPSSDEVINVLRNTRDNIMFLDIETDIEERNLLCFAFCFLDGKVVYSVPMLSHEYRWSYTSLPFIHRALSIACRNNVVVAHNGAAFDFLVFAYKYGICVFKPYDTMLTQHRIFPDIEKSLMHCVSYWTYQRFHKDTDSAAYTTPEHRIIKLQYCAKDVFTMWLIYKAQLEYAKTIPGLMDSINLVQRSIIPYMVTTLQGIRYRPELVKRTIDENDRWMFQYNRIIECLIGEEGLREIKSSLKSKKSGLFPGSSRQCVTYFHDILKYPVIAHTDGGNPALGKTSLYRLALLHDNPVIKLVNLYRATQKETGALDFNPWKDDNGKIMPWQRVRGDLEDEHEFD